MRRARLKAKRSKPRRGRIKDPAFLAFMAKQPCLVTGLWPVTLHHVRRNGEPKNDRRVVPLIAALHLIQLGPLSVEAMGRWGFQELHEVDFEAAILRYNAEYDKTFPPKHVL